MPLSLVIYENLPGVEHPKTFLEAHLVSGTDSRMVTWEMWKKCWCQQGKRTVIILQLALVKRYILAVPWGTADCVISWQCPDVQLIVLYSGGAPGYSWLCYILAVPRGTADCVISWQCRDVQLIVLYPGGAPVYSWLCWALTLLAREGRAVVL